MPTTTAPYTRASSSPPAHTSRLARKVAGVERAVPSWPVRETDFLEPRERHGHDVAVAALLTPFADAVSAPVAAELGFGMWWGEAGECLGSGWDVGMIVGGAGAGCSRLVGLLSFGSLGLSWFS